jgi:phosphatidylglycerophosphate synthase
MNRETGTVDAWKEEAPRMRDLANLISLSRIFMSLLMVLSMNHMPVFIALYLACGLSDVLDGFVARRTRTQSVMGARLDSLGDVFMFSAIFAILVLKAWDALSPFLPCILGVVLIRLVNMGIAAWKFRLVVLGLHTWGNKLTGVLVYFSPLLLMVWKPAGVLFPACLICLLAALEETAIHLTSNRIDLNRRSFFVKD